MKRQPTAFLLMVMIALQGWLAAFAAVPPSTMAATADDPAMERASGAMSAAADTHGQAPACHGASAHHHAASHGCCPATGFHAGCCPVTGLGNGPASSFALLQWHGHTAELLINPATPVLTRSESPLIRPPIV